MAGRTRLLWRTIVLASMVALVIATAGRSAASTVARSWFDQPLPASQHALGAIAVTAHSTSPGGISAVELLVDGIPAGTLEFPAAPRLATADFTWQPLEERPYWLVVRGKSGAQWGPPAAILVQVGTAQASPSAQPSASAGPSPTATRTVAPTALATVTPTPGETTSATPSPSPTPRLTASPTPRPTASPTPRVTPSPTPRSTPNPTPCTPAEPALTDPETGQQDVDERPTLSWEYFGECQPAGFRIEIYLIDQVGDPVEVGSVGAQVRQWKTPPLLNCQQYQWRVFAKKVGGGLGPGSEVHSFEVQFERTCPTP